MSSEDITSLVRPFVTFGVAAAVVYGFISGTLGPGEFLGIAGMVIGFWFRDPTETRM